MGCTQSTRRQYFQGPQCEFFKECKHTALSEHSIDKPFPTASPKIPQSTFLSLDKSDVLRCYSTVYVMRQIRHTSVPETLLFTFFPNLSHIISVNVRITQRALQDTNSTGQVAYYIWPTMDHKGAHFAEQVICCLTFHPSFTAFSVFAVKVSPVASELMVQEFAAVLHGPTHCETLAGCFYFPFNASNPSKSSSQHSVFNSAPLAKNIRGSVKAASRAFKACWQISDLCLCFKLCVAQFAAVLK